MHPTYTCVQYMYTYVTIFTLHNTYVQYNTYIIFQLCLKKSKMSKQLRGVKRSSVFTRLSSGAPIKCAKIAPPVLPAP